MRNLIAVMALPLAMIAPAAVGAAISVADATIVGSKNGNSIVAHSTSRSITTGRGHQFQSTRMENGQLVTYHVAVFGRFGGAVRTKTPADISRLWHQSFG